MELGKEESKKEIKMDVIDKAIKKITEKLEMLNKEKGLNLEIISNPENIIIKDVVEVEIVCNNELEKVEFIAKYHEDESLNTLTASVEVLKDGCGYIRKYSKYNDRDGYIDKIVSLFNLELVDEIFEKLILKCIK